MLHAATLTASIVAALFEPSAGVAADAHGVAVCLRVSSATLEGRASSDRPESEDRFGTRSASRLGAQPEQWIRVLADAGIDLVLLHARTDEGFCLWPSDVAEQSTRGVAWRDGAGDLVRELSDRATERGMRFGLSLAADGAGQQIWSQQMEELADRVSPSLPILRIETAGAPPEQALIDDARRSFPKVPIAAAAAGDIRLLSESPGIDERSRWEPREVSVPLRPNFFWRQSENEHIRNLARLESLWYETAGRGALLLLHVPIDGDGRIAEPDARRLRELHELLQANFRTNLLRGAGVVMEAGLDRAARDSAPATGATPAADPRSIVDGDVTTGISIPAARSSVEWKISLERPTAMNHIVLIEHADALGRLTACTVEVEGESGAWERIGAVAGIGPRRVLRFPTRMVSMLRVAAEAAEGTESGVLAEVQAFAAPPTVTIDGPVGAWTEPVAVTLRSDDPSALIRYTLDGRTPTEQDEIYERPLPLAATTRIRAAAWRGAERSTRIAERTFVRNDAANFRSAVQFIVAPTPGLRMRRFRGGFITVRAMDALEPVEERIVERLGLPKDRPPDQFGLIFEGFVEAPVDGIYTFALRSDDGSVLWLHNELLIDRDGAASWEWHRGRVALAAGWHPIRLAYYDISGEERLQVRWSGPGFEEEDIPAARLAH
jgi:alpha-L-fucosidase